MEHDCVDCQNGLCEHIERREALKDWECPTCNGFIPNNKEPGAYSGAISRRDNKTEICSDCGVIEALEEMLAKGN